MNVRARGFAGAADETDRIALIHALALYGDNLAHMTIERLSAVRMGDDDIGTIAAVISAGSSDDDDAGGGRMYRSSGRSGKVDGVIAMKTLRLSASVDRALIVILIVRTAGAAESLRRVNSRARDGRRCRHARFAVGNDDGRAYSKSFVRSHIVIGQDIVHIGPIFSGDRFEGVAFDDLVAHSVDREDDELVAFMDGAADIIGPDDGIRGNAVHFGDLRESIARMYYVEADLGRSLLRNIELGAVYARFLNQSAVVHHGDIGSSDACDARRTDISLENAEDLRRAGSDPRVGLLIREKVGDYRKDAGIGGERRHYSAKNESELY